MEIQDIDYSHNTEILNNIEHRFMIGMSRLENHISVDMGKIEVTIYDIFSHFEALPHTIIATGESKMFIGNDLVITLTVKRFFERGIKWISGE